MEEKKSEGLYKTLCTLFPKEVVAVAEAKYQLYAKAADLWDRATLVAHENMSMLSVYAGKTLVNSSLIDKEKFYRALLGLINHERWLAYYQKKEKKLERYCSEAAETLQDGMEYIQKRVQYTMERSEKLLPELLAAEQAHQANRWNLRTRMKMSLIAMDHDGIINRTKIYMDIMSSLCRKMERANQELTKTREDIAEMDTKKTALEQILTGVV